ncbi:thiopurine S-methyltransferase [Dechloromonas sp. ZY10]|uniref:thiopurine S-methyltransferase n=1 Tax=Dechloromonas aquae TaxID=2664436 RepID=UPI003527C451
MNPEFWHARWANNEIGFHLDQVQPLLVEHFGRLALAAGQRVLVPLCGKTRDIGWLLAQGLQVVGVELSRLAVEQLFADLGLEPVVEAAGAGECFRASGLTVLVGDFFAVSREQLGLVDAVYDRAALVALPPEMRSRYAEQLAALSERAPQLLITLEYDPALHPGPPFSLGAAEVGALYDAAFHIDCLQSLNMPEGLKGRFPATEHVWRLQRR